MTKSEMIRARIEPNLKLEAERVLHDLGLSPTSAITLFYRQVVLQKGLPFGVLLPNEKTRKALTKSRRGDVVRSPDVSHFFEELGFGKEEASCTDPVEPGNSSEM